MSNNFHGLNLRDLPLLRGHSNNTWHFRGEGGPGWGSKNVTGQFLLVISLVKIDKKCHMGAGGSKKCGKRVTYENAENDNRKKCQKWKCGITLKCRNQKNSSRQKCRKCFFQFSELNKWFFSSKFLNYLWTLRKVWLITYNFSFNRIFQKI